jgi:hypothetical protein
MIGRRSHSAHGTRSEARLGKADSISRQTRRVCAYKPRTTCLNEHHGMNAPTADQKRTAFPQLNLAAVATITSNGPNQGLFS